MEEVFELMQKRVLDMMTVTDLQKTKDLLNQIRGNTLCVGSGGSRVVASYASLIFNYLNGDFTKVVDPREALYERLDNTSNIFISSYSGNNLGVEATTNNNCKKFLLTAGDIEDYPGTIIKYESSLPKEKSFISLASTIMPMSILLNYYLGADSINIINDIFDSAQKNTYNISKDSHKYAIMSGIDTLTPETFIESTLVEAGLGYVTKHNKYDYCHGRATLAFNEQGTLIYLASEMKELDYLLLECTKERFSETFFLEGIYHNPIIDNYYLSLCSMYLLKNIAQNKQTDLSQVQYDKEVGKRLYKYHGNM